MFWDYGLIRTGDAPQCVAFCRGNTGLLASHPIAKSYHPPGTVVVAHTNTKNLMLRLRSGDQTIPRGSFRDLTPLGEAAAYVGDSLLYSILGISSLDPRHLIANPSETCSP